MAETAKSDDKVLAAVATIPLVGLILYFAMSDASAMVKNYAKQSNALLALNVVVFVLSLVLSFVPVVQCLTPLLSLVPLAAWVLLLVKALQEVPDYKLPVIGEMFDKMLK
ncbi:MAG TPA: hypothetical protein PKU95_00050 [Candidatus Dojkabacteria bacterium]|jgi:uncharacterized membrane protein|nr:hypothetical protein [Candidatus Dojkabacteria bacterium]